MRTASLLLLASLASAQDPGAATADPPSAPPATAAASAAPEASTSSVIQAGDGLHVGGEAGEKPKPKLSRPVKAHIPKSAKEWEPIGLAEGGDPYQGSTGVTLKLVKSAKGGYKGERSKAKAFARAYPIKTGETLLVIAVFPKALEKRRKHFEVRLRVVEGNVEKAEVAMVKITDRHAYKEVDRVELRKAGASFEEENPGSGLVTIAALDFKPGSGLNVGRVSRAEFADPDAGFADVSWNLKKVEKP